MEAQLKLNAWLAFFYYKNVKNTINCCLFYEALPPFNNDNIRFVTLPFKALYNQLYAIDINCMQLISIVTIFKTDLTQLWFLFKVTRANSTEGLI